MGFFDEVFDPAFMFDNETRQRRDIESLRSALAGVPDATTRLVVPLQRRVDQLELFSKALCELLLAKKVVAREELSVMMQQLDLLDGTEDGRIAPEKRRHAPRCARCSRFVNPQREACINCGAAIERDPDKRTALPPRTPKPVTCVACKAEVDEADTYYSDDGLRCERCYSPG